MSANDDDIGQIMQPGHKKRGATRLQIMGAPGEWKTSIALTFDKPELIIGMPGEKHTDLFEPTDTLKGYVFNAPDYSNTNVDWVKMWQKVRLKTRLLLEGEMGQFETIVFDGVHKAFDVCYYAAKQKFASSSGDGEWEGRRGWPWIKDEFLAWFSQGYYSKVPWVVWIVWSAKEQDDQLAVQGTKEAARQSIWPEYAGKFQRTAMGETNIIYQYVDGGKAYWQLRQDAKVKGVGLRVAPEKAEKLPVRIPAVWSELKKILQA
jgi:hypothetical protein